MALAGTVGGAFNRSGLPSLANFVFRAAGWATALFGGRLVSRVISFAVPAGDTTDPVSAVLASIERKLEEHNIRCAVSCRAMSRDDAIPIGSDAIEMLQPDVNNFTFYEVFVPTHHYDAACHIVADIMRCLHEDDRR